MSDITDPSYFAFPQDIKDSYHFMKFSSFRYQRTSRGQLPDNPGYTGHVVLPLPPNLMANYGANWGTSEFSPIQNMAMNSPILRNVGNVIKDNGLKGAGLEAIKQAQGIASRLSEYVRNIGQRKAEADTNASKADAVTQGFVDKFFDMGIGGQIASSALDSFNDSFGGNGVSIGLGISRNPHIAVYYVQPELRTHTFSYKLSPKNSRESEIAKEIIRFFKRAQAPSVVGDAGNHLYKYPDEFQITFNNEENLFKILNCVLKDFTVNYHGQGQAAYFRDTKAPVDVEISLTFQELGVITQELVDQGY